MIRLDFNDIDVLLFSFANAQSRYLALDYDGTLVPFAAKPSLASPDKPLLDLIATIGSNPRNHIVIVSGRDHFTLGEWFHDVPVILVAEHGAMIKRKNVKWSDQVTFEFDWKLGINTVISEWCAKFPSTFVEEKKYSLACHYRNVNDTDSLTCAGSLKKVIENTIKSCNYDVELLEGNKVIEVRQRGVNKGAALLKILEEVEPDFITVIGDDTTDEDMFIALARRATTIKVGFGNSAASYFVNSYKEVLQLLKLLSQIA